MTAPGIAEAEEGVRFDLRSFARSASLLSLGSLANLLRAVVSAKLFAVALGPSAVGILIQLLNFSAFVSTIIPLGLTTGVAKMVAEAGGDERKTSRVVGSSALLSVGAALAACVILLPAAGRISVVLTGSARYESLVALLILSFPLYNLAGAVGYVLQGFSAVRRLTRASVANAAATVAVLVPATIAFGLTGSVASVLVGSAVQSGLYIGELWLAYRERGWRLAAVRIARRESRVLLRFGTVLLIGGMASWGSLLVVRTVLVQTLGERDNGLYQAVYGFSSQYIAMFMMWMAAYVFPRIAARGAGQLGQLLNSALRANLFLMVPLLCAVVALREPLIQVFYSRAFVAAAPLVPIQALGDYVRVAGWSMGVALFALGRVRAHLLLIAGQSVLWVLFTAALVPRLGLPGISVAYALSFVPWPLLAYPMLRAWFGFRLTGLSWWLMGAGLATVVAASLAPQPFGALAVPVVPLLILLQRRLRVPTATAAP
jgi:O-antigen/teichoic acid export membrane protein